MIFKIIKKIYINKLKKANNIKQLKIRLINFCNSKKKINKNYQI